MKRVCQYCGKELSGHVTIPTCHDCAVKYKNLLAINCNRIKYQKPKHTPADLESIRQKYKDGVPAGEVEKWINTL